MDSSSFPIREGGSVPRELIAPYTDALARGHGVSLNVLAMRGGISVYELLLLLPPAEGVSPQMHRSNVCDFTLSQALAELQRRLVTYHQQKEAEAEAAMLKMMEEGAA